MNKDVYARRRAELVSQISERDIVIVSTSQVKSRNGDVDYQFRADSDFYYLSGFMEPESVLVISPGRAQGEYILFCREKDIKHEMWHGRRFGLEGAMAQFGADDAFPIEDINDILPGLMEEKEKVYTTVGRYPDFDAQLLGWMTKIKEENRLGKNAPYEFVDLNHLLHEQRLIKSKDEIALLESLNTLISNINTYNKVEIANNAKEKYSYETVGKQFLEIYHKILANWANK